MSIEILNIGYNVKVNICFPNVNILTSVNGMIKLV
ncbi:hypothetical protein Catovirus_1_1014 [Catovirus CTV1]|uniref:Uncharacterized protein n=1 Tax=Catovirus CTV1 TaxID=1977631 RepID=A0A1V0SBB2_9VIRU|nr:hypothetical protein Catovirus_1_1014 [Catovirus CTV1]